MKYLGEPAILAISFFFGGLTALIFTSIGHLVGSLVRKGVWLRMNKQTRSLKGYSRFA